MLQLENTALLPLLILAFLPILLHILDRRRARTVVWPAIRFLLQVDKRHLRRLRLLETLLIVCRTLAILLIVLALVRPHRMEMASHRNSPTGKRSAILLFDTSLSMAYRDADTGVTSLERAQDNALRLLESFRPQDEVLLWVDRVATSASAVASEAIEQSGNDIESVRAQVRALQLGGPAFRLLDALEAATDEIASSTIPLREVFVFTDLVASTVEEADHTDSSWLRSRLPPDVKVHVIDCGAEKPRNHYVWRLATGPLASVSDREMPLEIGVGLSAEPPLASQGTEETPADPLAVRVYSGLEELSTHEVSPAAGEQRVISAPEVVTGEGETLLSARLPTDGLVEDNVAYRVVQVDERIPVLLVGTEPRGLGSARFVHLALRPVIEDSPPSDGVFEVDFTETLVNEQLERYHTIVLCDPSTLDQSSLVRIEEYVRLGGGLLFFVGSQVNIEQAQQLYRGSKGVLPARLATLGPDLTVRQARPRDINVEHPALRLFADPEQGDFERIQVYRWRNVVELAPDATVLAHLSTVPEPTPWIVEKQYGQGIVVLVTTDATPRESTLPRTPLFLPFLHQFGRYVATRLPAERNLVCGEAIRVDVTDPTALRDAFVTDTEGRRHDLELIVENGEPRATFDNTDRPGPYTVHWPNGDSTLRRRVFAVNFPPTESLIERASPEVLARLKNDLAIEVRRSIEERTEQTIQVASAQHLWPMIVVLALVFLFTELVLARLLARGRHR